MKSPCGRCQSRLGAIEAMGFERYAVAPAVGVFHIVKPSGKTQTQALCAEDVRGMRASGWKLTEAIA